MTPETKGPTPAEVLAGGTERIARNIVGGESEIMVRILPVREYQKMLAAIDDEAALLRLYTGLEEIRIEALRPDSWSDLVETGDRLNADFFGSWLRRRLDRQELVVPGITARMVDSVSQRLSPASVSPPAGPARPASPSPLPG